MNNIAMRIAILAGIMISVLSSQASWDGTDLYDSLKNAPHKTVLSNGVEWCYYIYTNYDYCAVWPKDGGSEVLDVPDSFDGYEVGFVCGVKNKNLVRTLKLPGSIREVENDAYREFPNLEEIEVRSNTNVFTVVGEAAFRECRSLKTVKLGEGVTQIERWCFTGCTNLETVLLPKTLRSIGDCAFAPYQDWWGFYEKENMKFLEFDGQAAYIGDWCITSSDGDVYAIEGEYLELRDGTRGIADGAFGGAWCTGVYLPEGLEYIGGRSLGTLSPLATHIPASVKYIGYDAFGPTFGWSSTSAGYPPSDENGVIYCDGWCFGPVDKNGWIENYYNLYPEERADDTAVEDEWTKAMHEPKRNLVIAEGTVGIVANAFNVTGLGGSSMSTVITNIVFPDSLKYIGEYAFENNMMLQSLVCTGNVERIGKFAFTQCTRLGDVNLSDRLKTIEYGAFYLSANITNFHTSAEYFETLSVYPLVSKYRMNLYLRAPVKYVGNCAFGNVNMIFEEGVTDIGKIVGAENATEITIPETVTNIADNAFANCTALSKLVLKIVNSDDVKFAPEQLSKQYSLKVISLPYNAKGYDDLVAELGAEKVTYTVGTESGYGKWVLVKGLAGQGAAADFEGKRSGNKYENGFLYVFGESIEDEETQLMQLEMTSGGAIAIRLPESEHEENIQVIGTDNVGDWSHPVYLKKSGGVWVMPDGAEPPKSFFYRVVVKE